MDIRFDKKVLRSFVAKTPKGRCYSSDLLWRSFLTGNSILKVLFNLVNPVGFSVTPTKITF